jgi:SAM-dependent methyltransferase
MNIIRRIGVRLVRSRLAQTTLDALGTTIARPLAAKYYDQSLQAPVGRAEFIASVPTDEAVLEIGPYDRPWLSGTAVRYFDVLSQDELKARAAAEPKRNPDQCPFIHYISPTGDLAIVDETFATVFSSHCIEHQPDLIKHLRDIGRLLRPGGQYYLIVPDKRFCFDHYLPASKLEEVRAAKGRSLHTEKAICEHTLGTTHNINILHWLGFHGRPASSDPGSHARNEEALSRAREGKYVDVHAWQFTPTSFRALIQQLCDAEEIDLHPTRVHNTAFGRIEFMAVLTRRS